MLLAAIMNAGLPKHAARSHSAPVKRVARSTSWTILEPKNYEAMHVLTVLCSYGTFLHSHGHQESCEHHEFTGKFFYSVWILTKPVKYLLTLPRLRFYQENLTPPAVTVYRPHMPLTTAATSAQRRIVLIFLQSGPVQQFSWLAMIPSFWSTDVWRFNFVNRKHLCLTLTATAIKLSPRANRPSSYPNRVE